jgi:hypothetical protein
MAVEEERQTYVPAARNLLQRLVHVLARDDDRRSVDDEVVFVFGGA